MINQRSLEYIITRIKSGETELTDFVYDSMFEVSPVNFLNEEDNEGQVWVNRCDNGKIINEVYYNVNADFNYFAMSRNVNDGTLLFMQTAIEHVLNKVMLTATYNKEIMSKVPNNKKFIDSHHLKYTIGNIVCCTEYSEEFATKEKPYLTSRYTALLPIKFEIVKN